MAYIDKCPRCGEPLDPNAAFCPHCGVPNDAFITELPPDGQPPRTIEQLRAWCLAKGMPLRQMRVFIGEDFDRPMAFGIYRDGPNVVVYKNKSDGSRAIRYRGPDEAHGVDELYRKILEECHNRGLYPDGEPPAPEPPGGGYPGGGHPGGRPPRRGFLSAPFVRAALIILAVVIVARLFQGYRHRQDGYYGVRGENIIYYRYLDDWYYTYTDADDDTWYPLYDEPFDDYDDYYDDYSLGDDWSAGWGVSDFRDSSAWDSVQDSSSNRSSGSGDSDWDSWDSGDSDWDSWDSDYTDWDSDW